MLDDGDGSLEEAELSFGTAGIRGKVGPGPGQMNLALVSKVSWALGRFLLKRQAGDLRPSAVIGYDARPDSRSFAEQSAAVLAALGLRVVLAKEPLPTPCIAFAVRQLRVSAGIVVTASHNPRGDNGIKVFDGDGVQIVSPWDREVAQLMDQSPLACDIGTKSSKVEALSEATLSEYFHTLRALAESVVPRSLPRLAAQNEELKVAYTALHGLGFAPLKRALLPLEGLIRLVPVPSQVSPDGEFPTIAFPNPEEASALDPLLKVAREQGCGAAFAHDPDADRFALCLPLGGEGLIRLSGDALGLLLAEQCLRSSEVAAPTLVSTIVSSPALEALAQLHSAKVIRTLTGFKWLCHAALEEPGFVFAYEEALGYCFRAPEGFHSVMDKDGIAAGCVVARLLACLGGGEGLVEELFSIYRRLGQWGSFGFSRRFEKEGGLRDVEERLALFRQNAPTEIQGVPIVEVKDYSKGAPERPWYLGSQNLLLLELERGRILMRPSGTEAKLKVYIHLRSEFEGASSYRRIQKAQEDLARAMFVQLLGLP